VDSLALHLFRTFANAKEDTPGALARRTLKRVLERIEEGVETGVSLDQLARDVGLSRYHLSRAFKSATGVSPHRYLTQRRVERAKMLIADTGTPLADIALAVGFSSQSHMSDSFRRLTGISPLAYKRRH
jgi:AraC family transcriptional regulator